MRTRTILLLYRMIISILLFAPASFIYAETVVSEDQLSESATWTKEGSPYVLTTDLTVPAGMALTLEPGTVVNGGTDFSINVTGSFESKGTEAEPVTIQANTIYMTEATAHIDHTILDHTEVATDHSTTTITNSKITGAAPALYARRGNLTVTGSELSNNATVFYGEKVNSVHLLLGPQKAYAASLDDPAQNHVTLNNNIIEGNSGIIFTNGTQNSVDATDNWWGSPNGPAMNMFSGPVDVSPWKTEDPRIPKITCCSNVLFLPGIEGSRLYRNDNDLLGGGVTEHRSWEPFTNADVRTLYISGGNSINETIHTNGILESAYGLENIYKSFVAMMNGVVAEKKINEWEPFAYDWRYAPISIVNGETKYSTTTRQLVAEIERLASTSKTGKVTIVAHSYGGLIAKVLGQELVKKGEGNLLDKVVMVAVPEFGTPEAIASLLHGADQEILGGLILKNDVARTLALGSPGAYSLIPSQPYFNNVKNSVVTLYGSPLVDSGSMMKFLTGALPLRTPPDPSDMKTPAVLNNYLVGQSLVLHSSIDAWKFPASTDVVSIAGWGTPTTMTIDYSSSTPRLRRGPDGDGTVVTGSALGYSALGNNIYFNQGLFDHDKKKNISHATILEAEPILSLMNSIVSTTTLSLATTNLPNYLVTTKPDVNSYPWMKWVTVSVHSPVDLDITDSEGRHMGFVPLSDKVQMGTTSDLRWFDNTIGGQYEEIGDEKYFTLPGDATYNVGIDGTGLGSFTFQVQKFEGPTMTETSNTIYADLPVTPLLTGSTTITSNGTTTLNLDVDSNGTPDIVATSSLVMNPIYYLDSMRGVIISLHLASTTEQNLLQKVDKIRTLIVKGKIDRATQKIQKIIAKLGTKEWKHKKLTDADKADLLTFLTTVLDGLDS